MIPFLKKNKDGKKPPKSTVPRTAQESIPFQRMFEDGTCRVRPGYYTRTIQYQDINYQLAQQEDKTAIFEEWCSFLNFFDSSIHFELSFVNTATDSADFEKSIRIPYQQDGFDDVRAEYSQMLRQQLSKGNNGLTKTKFLTYGIEGDSMEQVKPRLEHIQNDLMNNFHRLGVLAKPLDGTERLRLMHGMLNMDGANKFHFNWKDLVPSGLSVKDAIAPTALAFKNSRTFQMGGIFGAVSFLNITASDLSDQLLKDFLDMDSSQIVTMHIQSVDQNKAIKTIKHTITELDRSKIEEQKKAVRAGYDMDVLPSDLATYGRDAKALLKELQSQNERMFLVTFLVLNTGKTEQELETNVFQAVSIAQKHNCELCRLDFQQEQGLMSSLPLADCQIEIQRGLTTSSTAIFVPFTTQELFDNGKESLYYGLNQYHLDEITHDPWQLTSFLTTLYDDYTRSEVQGKLKETFKKQYKLTTWVEVQTRYRTVVMIDIFTGIPYTTQVPYQYKIFHTKLENRGLEVVIREELTEDQWKRYEIFQDTKGGRPYLFKGGLPAGGSDGSGTPGIDYTVPAEALTDEEFAAIYKEAQKYVGTPYVWGGSTPETGFDCSGYVCWVYNQNGYNVGRTTANGLWNKSQHISEAEAKPGDLVFFEGTYDTPGKSHVGIYLGNGMMVSAGDPIKYADIHSSYWQKYLSGFGRLSK